jgi:hypothetical protein
MVAGIAGNEVLNGALHCNVMASTHPKPSAQAHNAGGDDEEQGEGEPDELEQSRKPELCEPVIGVCGICATPERTSSHEERNTE